MAITFIRRDWGDNLSIVRIITTDTLATVATANYLQNQVEVISQINSGPFTWSPTDFVLVYASDGFNFFVTNSTYTSLSVASIGGSIPLPLAIVSGGTGVTSVTTSPTASSWAGWDANKNISANNLLSGYTTTVTAAALTTLTVSSSYYQFFTGTTTQTVKLPVTSTLKLGQSFYIVNNSTGIMTVESSGSNVVQTMSPNTAVLITCILTSGTTAASWNAEYSLQDFNALDIQNQSYVYCIDSGTANTYVANPSPAITSLVAGLQIKLLISNSSTSFNPTLNVSGLGAQTITVNNIGGGGLWTDALSGGMIADLEWDGSEFQLLNPAVQAFPTVITASQIQNESFTYHVTTGSAGTFAISLTPAVTSYVAGLAFRALMSDNAAGNDTLAINGLSALTIVSIDTLSPLVGGEFTNGMIADFAYDGTNLQLLNPIVQAGATLQQVQQQSANYHVLSGSANTYTVNLIPNIGSYVAGLFVVAKVNTTNTGASTININSHGAKAIKYTNGNALVGGELLINSIVLLEYDGTEFQVLNPYVPSLPLTGGTLTGNLAFNPTTDGITGTTTNDSAPTGTVGEYIRSDVQFGSPVSLTSITPANVTSISLTAGDWQVTGLIGFNIASSTVCQFTQGGASTTSATLPANNNNGFYVTPAIPPSPGFIGLQMIIPTQRISIASTTTVYLVANADFSVSTISAYGYIAALRVR